MVGKNYSNSPPGTTGYLLVILSIASIKRQLHRNTVEYCIMVIAVKF